MKKAILILMITAKAHAQGLPSYQQTLTVLGITFPCASCERQSDQICLVKQGLNAKEPVPCEKLLQNHLREEGASIDKPRLQALMVHPTISEETKDIIREFLPAPEPVPQIIIPEVKPTPEVKPEPVKQRSVASGSLPVGWILLAAVIAGALVYRLFIYRPRIHPGELGEILARFGLMPGASVETLRARYRAIAKNLHPDTAQLMDNFQGDMSNLVQDYRTAKKLIKESEKNSS